MGIYKEEYTEDAEIDHQTLIPAKSDRRFQKIL